MQPTVSVVIPTYNRKESLLRTLESLVRQTYPAERFEVIVVDDGGDDGTEQITEQAFPFAVHYVRQDNSGGVAARNRGAALARGDLLVFLDDDMTAAPGYLAALAFALAQGLGCLVRGRLVPWDGHTSVFARTYAATSGSSRVLTGDFASNNLALWRTDFDQLGGWRDLLADAAEHRGGIWSDLEFAVRAQEANYQLFTVDGAEIIHRDYAVDTLASACERARMVSRLAAFVLEQCPQLAPHIPMVHDKAPVRAGEDSPALILRKSARRVMSSGPIVWVMKGAVPLLERHAPRSAALRLLYRWIISGYIYRGYRSGLRESIVSGQPNYG